MLELMKMMKNHLACKLQPSAPSFHISFHLLRLVSHLNMDCLFDQMRIATNEQEIAVRLTDINVGMKEKLCEYPNISV